MACSLSSRSWPLVLGTKKGKEEGEGAREVLAFVEAWWALEDFPPLVGYLVLQAGAGRESGPWSK